MLWAILLMLAMLAVFDTQVLSIFRRQKEIGTYIALGMTRKQVVTLFTLEGAMHAVLAAIRRCNIWHTAAGISVNKRNCIAGQKF